MHPDKSSPRVLMHNLWCCVGPSSARLFPLVLRVCLRGEGLRVALEISPLRRRQSEVLSGAVAAYVYKQPGP